MWSHLGEKEHQTLPSEFLFRFKYISSLLVGWKTLYPQKKTLENLHMRESTNYSKTRQTGSVELIDKVQVDRFWSSTFTNMVALQ